MEIQRNPDSIHCSVLPTHINSVDELLKDLRDAVDFIYVSLRTDSSEC